MATILLFHFPPSLQYTAVPVRLALEELDVSWQGRVVNTLTFANYKPEYAELNQALEVPADHCAQ